MTTAETPWDAFRACYVGAIALAVGVQFSAHWRWVSGRNQERVLPRFWGLVAMPRVGRRGFAGLALGLMASLALAALGVMAPAALGVAAVAALVYFAQLVELPNVRRKPNTVPVILGVLAAAALPSTEPGREWLGPLLIKLLIAQLYFSSALMKLQGGGWRWTQGTTLRMSLLRYRLRDGNRAAEWLAGHPSVCRGAATFVLLFELTFWLVIPFPMLAWIYVPCAVLFHAGTAVLMRIHYWIYLGPAYLIFAFA